MTQSRRKKNSYVFLVGGSWGYKQLDAREGESVIRTESIVRVLRQQDSGVRVARTHAQRMIHETRKV